MNTRVLNIRELDLDMIHPNPQDILHPEDNFGSSKIVVIGKPGSGKSQLITSILYKKRNLIPTALIMSGTEDSNHHYQSIVPSTFVYNKLNTDKMKDFRGRQKVARKYLENPWSLLILDDCTDNPSTLRTPLFQDYFKNGRHWSMLFIVSLQYCMDILPSIRTNIDGVFILRETNLKNRKALYENYAGVIPTFKLFCDIMDALTEDYNALYIHNAGRSNNWEECVFYYKAPYPIPDFKFGSPDFWKFHETRYNQHYKDPFEI